MHNVWAIGRMLVLWCHSPVWKTAPQATNFTLGIRRPHMRRPVAPTCFPFRHAIASRKTDQSYIGILTFRDGYLLSQEQTPDRMTTNTHGLNCDLLIICQLHIIKITF